MNITMRRALCWVASCVGAVIACGIVLFIGYAVYLETGYYRIPDNQPIAVEGQVQDTGPLKVGKDYHVATYNVGFGAYTPDYTFFMDEGVMKDGTKKTGFHGRAVSKESVLKCTNGQIDTLKKAVELTSKLNEPLDFIMFQEIDISSDRSYHVNQVDMVKKAFSDYQSAFASNFHSRYLLYPLYEPHGAVQSGLLTLSKYKIASALRRSYYVTQKWPTKYFDLDRCFLMCRIPVANGRDLVLVNSHMSAYDKGGTSREKQLALISSVMRVEQAKNNYVIVGGDWNHALFGTVNTFPSAQKIPEWVSILNDKDIPQGFHMVKPQNADTTPTCRGVDIAYKKGVTYTTIVDGFCVSNNVKATAQTIDTEFAYADHNPQVMSFELTGKA